MDAVELSTSVYTTNHTMGSIFAADGWAGIKWPYLVGLIFLTILYYAGEAMTEVFYECFPSMRIGDIEINEDISDYWASLDEEDRKWSTREEENARDVLKTKILTND